VLLADLVPAMVLGPLFGAAADRWSRRACLVVADVVRVAAFAGIAFVDGFGPTLALALVAGAGTGLFTPAALAALPGLVESRRLPAATSLYGVLGDIGFTGGPAVAAGLLLVGSAEDALLLNAATFAVSAFALARLPFGGEPDHAGPDETQRRSLLHEAREGVRVAAGAPWLRVLLLASAAALFFGGVFNVGQLPFATGPLGTTGAGYSILVALYGLGFVGGSLMGSRGGGRQTLVSRYLIGVLVMGAGFLAAGLSPTFALTLVPFAAAGLGNGLLLVHERLLVQTTVPDAMLGRVFGIKDALTAWAFGTAFVLAGSLAGLVGSRGLVVIAGAGTLAAWAVSAPVLRRRSALAGGPQAVRDRLVGEYGADLVDGQQRRLAVLDHLEQGGDDARIELGPGVRR
jgi:MFS family permease